MSIFCVINDNDSEFNTNMDMDFSYADIEEWKHTWNPEKYVDRRGKTREYGYVTYKIVKESKHFPNSKFEEKALTIALRQWGLRTKNIRFKRERTDKTADIEMRFMTKEDDKFFRDRPATLAYAYFPNSHKIGGDITFNDSVIWSTNGKPVNAHDADPDNYPPHTKTKLRTYNMVHTLLHECGHAIGLKHCQEHKTCIMYPYYNGRVVLHDHDVTRIQTMYGKRTLSERIIDIFRKRMQRRWGSD